MAKSSKGKGAISDKAKNWLWLLLSLAAALALWTLLSVLPNTSRSFPNVIVVLQQIPVMIERNVLFKDISSSLISVGLGYLLGFMIALPVAILMAWYNPFRRIVEPWIQFIRNIPPLAYVPLIVIAAGVGRKPQVIVITIATFLIMCITIYQGIIKIDETLIKAARVLGAKDKDIFLRVLAPASLPFILTAVRLGASVALTTLIAAESTGAFAGLGMRIRSLNNNFETAPMLLYIIIIGIIGILALVELCRRCVGLPILCVAGVLLIYTFASGQDLFQVVRTLFYTTNGIFGTPVNTCAKFIVIFIIFGAFLERTGVADFFIRFANTAVGRFTGGPAKVAVVASALEGMASGSSVANTVGSGSITIPMMKKMGYRPEFAAAVEAAASTGGQIMPPIMGAAAFLMAEYTGQRTLLHRHLHRGSS